MLFVTLTKAQTGGSDRPAVVTSTVRGTAAEALSGICANEGDDPVNSVVVWSSKVPVLASRTRTMADPGSP
jgi:hypothetical protein